MKQEYVNVILDFMNINQPRNDKEAELRIRSFRSLAKENFKPFRTFKSGKFKGCVLGKLGSLTYLRSENRLNYVLC